MAEALTRLPAGGRLAGPAVIEEGGATTVVPPGWRIAVLETGDLLMEREDLDKVSEGRLVLEP